MILASCYKGSVIEDAAARELLDEIVAEWTCGGVLGPLCELIPTVWRTDLNRHEPVRLGDDATSLGIQASRNICNLAIRRLAGVPGVQARDAKTLEVTYRKRVLHIGKITSRSESWDVSSVDWSQSDVRSTCAEANTAAYVPVAGTLFEDVGPLAGQPADPRLLRHLILMWQGLDDGNTRSWLGFPRTGEARWFAVVRVGDEPGGHGGIPADDTTPVPPVPDFDTLSEPTLEIVRRPERKPRSS